MNQLSSSCQVLSAAAIVRLQAIANATNELNRCIEERPKATCLNDRWGIFLGEMDWYTELHRLLYEGEKI